jgi:hypothetical protein
VREIGTWRKVQRASVVVEGGEARSEGDSEDIVLDEPVDVDDGGGIHYKKKNKGILT